MAVQLADRRFAVDAPWSQIAPERHVESSVWTSFSPSGDTDSMPTSAPLIRALCMASRNSGSSPASIVIWVKNTMSDGTRRTAILRSVRVTG